MHDSGEHLTREGHQARVDQEGAGSEVPQHLRGIGHLGGWGGRRGRGGEGRRREGKEGRRREGKEGRKGGKERREGGREGGGRGEGEEGEET